MPADNPVHPIAIAWVSAGGTGAQNYDEFADPAEITAVVAAAPDSVLAVEMPHCTPAARAAGATFAESLPAATQRLRRLKRDGRFHRHTDLVAPYRITSAEATAYGLLVMVDTDQISTSGGHPGRVIRNEDVFAATVAQRVELIGALRHLLSPVLLLAADAGAELDALLPAVVAGLGSPAVTDTDPAGRTHEVWLMPAGGERDRLLAAAGAGRLIVADGNHRSLAAQQAGLPRFLGLVTTPGSLGIRPYNRLVERIGMADPELLRRLAAAGAVVTPAPPGWAGPEQPGVVGLTLSGGRHTVRLPAITTGTVVDRLDHSVVERVVLGDVLGLAPDDPGVRYIGGDYPASWLDAEVAAGRAEAAIAIAPVPMADFVAVNLQRLKMPRKSTWFTPKARAGLVLAELPGEAAD